MPRRRLAAWEVERMKLKAWQRERRAADSGPATIVDERFDRSLENLKSHLARERKP